MYTSIQSPEAIGGVDCRNGIPKRCVPVLLCGSAIFGRSWVAFSIVDLYLYPRLYTMCVCLFIVSLQGRILVPDSDSSSGR